MVLIQRPGGCKYNWRIRPSLLHSLVVPKAGKQALRSLTACLLQVRTEKDREHEAYRRGPDIAAKEKERERERKAGKRKRSRMISRQAARNTNAQRLALCSRWALSAGVRRRPCCPFLKQRPLFANQACQQGNAQLHTRPPTTPDSVLRSFN